MAIFATAGAKLYIGGSLAAKTTDFVVGDFSGQSWVEIGWLENIGAVGDEATPINFDAIGQNRTYKLKGTRNAGDMTVVAGIDYADAGQILARAAEISPNNFAFRLQFNDMPSGGTTPSYRYFIALVMSVREALETANNVMKLNLTLGVNSNIVRVNAS